MLSILALLAIGYALRVIRAIRRQRLLTDDVAGCCQSLGFVGCSVVCSGVKDIAHIERLLAQEYDRYELLLTLDAERQIDDFKRIVARYKLLRVNCNHSGELPATELRALYRSRQRGFRRLILCDVPDSDKYTSLNTALSIASYGYILPIGSSTLLCHRAIEYIAITLSDPRNRSINLLESRPSQSYVFRREWVVGKGGFSPHIVRQAKPYERLTSYTPITYKLTKHRRKKISMEITIFSITSALFIVAGLLVSRGVAMAIFATIALLVSTMWLVMRLCSQTKCSVRMTMCYFQQIGQFFRRRVFKI